MNSATIIDSQHAIEQAKQIGLLTWLASTYIPLSFTTSFFGMNMKTFGSGSLSMWLWLAITIPLSLLSYLVLPRLGGDLGRLLYRIIQSQRWTISYR